MRITKSLNLKGFFLSPKDHIVLGALLHDIGKLYERAKVLTDHSKDEYKQQEYCLKQKEGYYSHKHVLYTLAFCEKLSDQIPFLSQKYKSDDNWLNIAARHHKPSSVLEHIVSKADQLSSGEREGQGIYQKDIHKKTLMESLLEKVSLSKRGDKTQYRLPLKALDHKGEDLFPKKLEDLGCEEEPPHLSLNGLSSEYQSLVHDLLSAIQKLPKLNNNSSSENLRPLISSLLSLFERFLIHVPSATNVASPDISLFDHLRVTAAIAESLYIHHQSNDSLNLSSIKNSPRDQKWTLVCGDFSGIQKFIYGVKSQRAAKSLAGRSLYIQLLCDASSKWLLRSLKLSPTGRIYSSGGKFYLLMAKCLKDKMIRKISHINKSLFEEYRGQIHLDFGTVDLFEADFKSKAMDKKFEEVSQSLLKSRSKKFLPLIKAIETNKTRINKTGINKTGTKETLEDLFEPKYVGERVCAVCGSDKPLKPNSPYRGAVPSSDSKKNLEREKFPSPPVNLKSTTEEEDITTSLLGQKPALFSAEGTTEDHTKEEYHCQQCKKFEYIGEEVRKILSQNYTNSESAQDQNSKDTSSAAAGGLLWVWSDEDYYTIKKILKEHRSFEFTYLPFLDKKPLDKTSKGKHLKDSERETPEGLKLFFLKTDELEKIKNIHLKDSFFEFVGLPPKDSHIGNLLFGHCFISSCDELLLDKMACQAKGIERLGILRMDVDNLGLIFIEGLKSRGQTGGQKTEEQKEQQAGEKITTGTHKENGKTFSTEDKEEQRNLGSLSRKASLSRQLNAFFTIRLQHIVKSTRACKIIYAGGDDLFIIGPWHELPDLAFKIHKDFKSYTGGNPDFSLSAGISIFSKKYPLLSGALEAGIGEQKAKDFNRMSNGNSNKKQALYFLDTVIGWEEYPQVEAFKDLIEKLLAKTKSKNLLQVLYSICHEEEEAKNMISKGLKKSQVYKPWRHRFVYHIARLLERHKGDEETSKLIRELKSLVFSEDREQKLKLNQKESSSVSNNLRAKAEESTATTGENSQLSSMEKNTNLTAAPVLPARPVLEWLYMPTRWVDYLQRKEEEDSKTDESKKAG